MVLPSIILAALAEAEVPVAAFEADLRVGFGKRQRYSTYAGLNPWVGDDGASRLPAMIVRPHPDGLWVGMDLGAKTRVECTGTATRIDVQDRWYPETMRISFEGQPVSAVLDHPVAARLDAPVRSFVVGPHSITLWYDDPDPMKPDPGRHARTR